VTALRDILDVFGFAHGIVRDKFPNATVEDRDELVSEAVALLYELDQGFDGARSPSFAGYAAHILRLRLVDVWRRLHPAAAASMPGPMSLDADLGRAQYAATMVLRPDGFPVATAGVPPFDMGSPAVRLGRVMLEAQIREEAPSLPTSSVQARAEKRARLWLHQAAGLSAEEAGAAEGVRRTQAHAARQQMERALETQDYRAAMRDVTDAWVLAGGDPDRLAFDLLWAEARDGWQRLLDDEAA
jgi:hypothetical protein